MKTYIKIILVVTGFSLLSCVDDPSSIKIKNKLPKVVIKNIRWGEVPISTSLLPGETSKIRTIESSKSRNGYDFSLPEAYPLKFYVEYNGDLVFLQTNDSYRLGVEENIEIVIDENTKIFNPF